MRGERRRHVAVELGAHGVAAGGAAIGAPI